MHQIEGGAAIDRDRGRRAAIENIVILQASPLRVWSVLTDFAGHPRWKPFTQLSGAAVEGGGATYSFRIGGLGKPATSAADIIRVDKPYAFAWTAGLAKLMLFEESYELERSPTGTRLRHSLRFHGRLAGVCTALLRRKLQAGLVQSDRCLERHLRRLAAQPGVRSTPSPALHGGRKPRRHK